MSVILLFQKEVVYRLDNKIENIGNEDLLCLFIAVLIMYC